MIEGRPAPEALGSTSAILPPLASATAAASPTTRSWSACKCVQSSDSWHIVTRPIVAPGPAAI
eukprot:4637149-Lingulodinium_polyedra.AAC.1